MMSILTVLLVTSCASAGTTGGLPHAFEVRREQPGLQQLVRAIVDRAEAHARAASHGASPGPLIIDVQGFIDAISSGVGQVLDSTQVSSAVGRPFLDLGIEESETCDPTRCRLVEDGVYVRLEQIESTNGGYEVVVAIEWNSPSGRDIDINIMRYTFVMHEHRWKLEQSTLLIAT